MYYIDFDNTIYETGRLTKDILGLMAEEISIKINGNKQNVDEFSKNKQEMFEVLKKSFHSSVDNFFTFSEKYCTEYKIDYSLLSSKILNMIINNGREYVFPDAINFLKKLKNAEQRVCILTYVENSKNLEQQALKLAGSGILELVSEVYSTTNFKFELDIDFENSIFIDDSPRDIKGFYEKGARSIIRMLKPNNEKRTSQKLQLPVQIPELKTFDDIE